MWGRILNNKKHFFSLYIVLFAIFFSLQAFAFPEYTTRQKALKLAAVLDQGFFKSIKISSVFVKNSGKDDYYLQAILDDGSSRKWLINRIREWAQTDDLILKNNLALVFPNSESTDFGVLDKNMFYRIILNATAFVKTFEKHDVLDGKSLVLKILRFRILQREDSKYMKSNKFGDRYRYVLELENGSKEFFTYSDAFMFLQRSALLVEIPENVSVLRKTFKVVELKKIPLEIEDELREIRRFGIEVVFDGPILMSPDRFPYQIVENKMKSPETGRYKTQFFLQIIFPNSEKIQEVSGFDNHEYLRFVRINSDLEHQKRVILSAMVNPDAINLPPYIEVTDRNSVIVNYYSSTDQSLIHPPDLLASLSTRELPRSVFTPDQVETEFETNYMQAVDLIRSAQDEMNLSLKIETYFKALQTLKQAALTAKFDIQIAQALNQRDILLKTMPKLIIRNVQMTILALQLDEQNIKPDPVVTEKLLKQLIHAENYSSTQDQRQKISSLKSILR